MNNRLETSYSSSREITLAEHIAELKELYSMISKYVISLPIYHLLMGSNLEKKNSHYPKEDFEAFISRMISVKKEVIEDFIRKKDNG